MWVILTRFDFYRFDFLTILKSNFLFDFFSQKIIKDFLMIYFVEKYHK